MKNISGVKLNDETLLGVGNHRRVYVHPTNPEWVIKILRDDGPDPQDVNSNWLEWSIWEKVKGTNLSRYFAPCIEMTEEGHLVMQRCKPHTEYLPGNLSFFGAAINDSKTPQNHGILNGRIVIIDYGHPSALPLLEKLCEERILKTETLLHDINLDDVWNSEELFNEWNKVEQTLKALVIPDETGGVNPGDRRALYYLVKYLNPLRVLEVGTHIGASTTHIAAALEDDASMTTVDVFDVNSDMHWRKYGTKRSPATMIQSLGLADKVEFVKSMSIDYLPRSGMFDLIFLDGNHSMDTVRAEVPLALEHLNPGGVILLHDYYPDNKPIWSKYPTKMISGPYNAIQQLRSEGWNIRAVPFGELPWPTTLKTNLTSLAILVQE
jgi:predicted O-methyltransferase YrrM